MGAGAACGHLRARGLQRTGPEDLDGELATTVGRCHRRDSTRPRRACHRTGRAPPRWPTARSPRGEGSLREEILVLRRLMTRPVRRRRLEPRRRRRRRRNPRRFYTRRQGRADLRGGPGAFAKLERWSKSASRVDDPLERTADHGQVRDVRAPPQKTDHPEGQGRRHHRGLRAAHAGVPRSEPWQRESHGRRHLRRQESSRATGSGPCTASRDEHHHPEFVVGSGLSRPRVDPKTRGSPDGQSGSLAVSQPHWLGRRSVTTEASADAGP